MIRILFGLIVIGLIGVGCRSGDPLPEGWVRWESELWQVRLYFPAKPVESDSGATPGVVRSNAYISRDVDTYQLICVELLKAPLTESDQRKNFESVKSAIAKNTRGRLRSERPDPLGDSPGVRLAFDLPDGRVQTVRCVLRDARTYTLSAITTRGKLESKELAAFFNSLTLL